MPFHNLSAKKPTCDRFIPGLTLIILTLTGLPFGTHAQPGISLNQAISLTLSKHPSLASFVHQNAANKGWREQAGVSTPMELNLNVEDVMGTGRYSGVSAMQTTLSISWLLEKDVIEARMDVADQKSLLSAVNRDIEALNLAAETARIFVALLSQKEQLKLAKLATSQAKQNLQQIEKRVRVGKANLVDQLRAKADLARRTLVVEDLVHEIEASRAQLAAQWQGDPDVRITGNLSLLPVIAPRALIEQKLKNNPALKIYATQKRIAQSEINLAKAGEIPPWRFSAGIRRNEVVDGIALTAGVSIPFGAENRNAGQVKALQQDQLKQDAEADAWFKRTSTQLLVLTHKLNHNKHVIEALESDVIPALDQASQQAGEVYRLGNYSYTDWYAAQQALLDAQNELIQSYTSIHMNNIELERLTGAAISN